MTASMRRTAARLRALSMRERVILLSGGAFLVLFLFTRFVVFARLDDYRRTRAAIPARQATLARYEAAASGRGAVDDALADAADRLFAWEEGLLPGDGPPAASVALQGIIKPWVERTDTRLLSVRPLAPAAKGPYTEVAVQVDLQTTTDGLAELLAHIRKHPLFLRVKKVSVNSSIYNAAMANRREVLMVTLVVSGMTYAPEEKPAGGER